MMSTTQTYVVMTCGHCESAVREEVSQIPDIGQIDVSASTGTLAITAGGPVDDAAVIAAVDEAGYQATHHHHDHDHDTGAASGAGFCGGHAPVADDLAQVGAEDVAECPVMVGTTVIKAQAEDAGLYHDYQGTRYYLCCDSCGPLFDADPDRYTAP